MELKLDDLISAIGGRCLNSSQSGHKLVKDIATDSRKVAEYTLFVPLKGQRFDAHDFISQVADQGALATLTEELTVRDDRILHIFVASTAQALLDLAAYYKETLGTPCVAITGSVGKTSTKDMVASVLGSKLKVHKTDGNFNNEIGLPLTLFKLVPEHEIAVIEMGMNHFNEIHRLSLTARPNIGIITNIGTSHIENLGSQEGILKAKLELLDGLEDGGLLVLNGDDPYLKNVKSENHRVIFFGEQQGNDYRCEKVYSEGHTTYATVVTPNDSYAIAIPALGIHMVYNSLAAIAVAEYVGLSKQEILKGLLAYTPSKMRMNITQSDAGVVIMDDAYNASPDSMQAALRVLSEYKVEGRRIAILGDMFEMGDFAPRLHEQVGECVADLNVDELYAVGELAEYIAKGALNKHKEHLKVEHFEKKETFMIEKIKDLKPGDVILVKASRGMQFEEIVETVRKVK